MGIYKTKHYLCIVLRKSLHVSGVLQGQDKLGGNVLSFLASSGEYVS